MNLFNVMTYFTPIAGAIGGGSAVKNSGTLTLLSGVIIGFSIGLGLIFSTGLLFRALARYEKTPRSQKLAMIFVFIVIPISLPILTFLISLVVVSAGLHF